MLQQTIKYSSISTRKHPFGYTTTIKKNTIVVTASYYPGIVYVFNRNTTDGTWNTTHPFKITAPSLAYSRFGWNDAGISDDERQIFVGADTVDKVCIYKLDANNRDWFLKQTLSPRDISIPISISIPGIWFGWSLSVQGNTLLVGAPMAYVNGKRQAGVCFVFGFDKTSGLWSNLAILHARQPAIADTFGYSVDQRDRRIYIGSDDRARKDKGAVFVFDISQSL